MKVPPQYDYVTFDKARERIKGITPEHWILEEELINKSGLDKQLAKNAIADLVDSICLDSLHEKSDGGWVQFLKLRNYLG